MDKKFEDKLAKLAFGDLTEAEAKEVNAHIAADADAAKMLASYEALRSDLSRMRDVPPDQLSKERLQNAILQQGLRPKPNRRAFPWAWTSSVAVIAAIAAGVILMPRSQPSTVALNDKDTNQSAPIIAPGINPMDLDLVGKDLNSFGSDATVALATPPAAVEIPVVSAPPAPVVRRKSMNTEMLAIVPRPRVSETRYQPETYRGQTRPDSSALVSKPAAKKASEPLVLIQSDKDNDTGASNAIEVHQTEDVIVSS